MESGFKRFGWDCENGHKCFVKRKVVDFEPFYGVLPGRVSCTDVDQIIAIGKRIVMFEWKDRFGDESSYFAQALLFRDYSRNSENQLGILVEGNSRRRFVSRIKVYFKGETKGWETCDFNGLLDRVKAWANK